MGLGLGPGLLDVHSSRASKLTPPGRTSAQIHTPQQQRDAAPHPAACPGVWAQPTEGDQGLPFFLSRPAFTSRSQSLQAVTQTRPRMPCQPWLRPRQHSFALHAVLGALPGLGPTFSRCLEPFCSWVLGWSCFKRWGSQRCRRWSQRMEMWPAKQQERAGGAGSGWG